MATDVPKIVYRAGDENGPKLESQFTADHGEKYYLTRNMTFMCKNGT